MNEIETLTLQRNLDRMAIPPTRKTDYRWLSRNLGILNSKHPKYDLTMELLRKELASEH